MTLTHDLRKVKDYKSLCYSPIDGQLSQVTNALIWSTLRVGIGEITGENYTEFFGRVRIIEKLRGASIRTGDKGQVETYIALAQVRDHIGLRTNVFPKVNATKWLKHLIDETVGDAFNAEAKQETPNVQT